MVENLDTWVRFDQIDSHHGVFEMSPLERGMGLTIGNALRRVVLSSLQGVAATSIKIDGVIHEFDSIKGVQEDVIDIIFNVKLVVFSLFNDKQSRTIRLNVSGPKDVVASDFILPPDVTIVNPDQHIMTITESVDVTLEFNVEQNNGYRASEDQDRSEAEASRIFLDSSFSPVVRVNHLVEDTRVGQAFDHDKLIMDIWTNGSVSAEDCMRKASSKLMESFSLFGELNRRPVFEDVDLSEASEEVSLSPGAKRGVLDILVEDLELSARSLNCLKKANINTVAELMRRDMSDLYNIKNFGKKSAEEISAKLREYDLYLAVDED
jgi:DNA-directed RNA polymerase subunit alpha